MTGTFSSVSSALSALRYNQVVMDVSSGNIANVSTDGYTRRRVVGESIGAPDRPAMWSRYDGHGDGVRIGSLERMVDPLLDTRARHEHSNQSFIDTQAAALARIETGLGEPAGEGISAAIAEFGASLHDLANNPDSIAVRTQVLANAQGLADAVAVQRRNIEAEEGDQRMALLADVDETNALAKDLADTNKAIAAAKLTGTDASNLLDSRDQMALRLAELTGGTAVENAKGGLDVTVGGVALVTGSQAGRLDVASGINADGTADGGPLIVTATPPGGSLTPVTGLRGEIGGEMTLLSSTLPGLRVDLERFAQGLADSVNTAHQAGFDADGNPGGALFRIDTTAPGGPLLLEPLGTDDLAASGLGGGPNRDGGNADAMADSLAGPERAYQQLVTSFGIQVASTRQRSATQQNLTLQVDGAREQLSGVNLDEEMVTMMQAQRAYEAAARVMTTLDSMLDTLINRTGLVR